VPQQLVVFRHAGQPQDGTEGNWQDTSADPNGLSPEERAAALNALQQASGRPQSDSGRMNTGYRNGMSDSEYQLQQNITQELNR